MSNGMLESSLWILIFGFFGGQIAQRLHLPALVGMVLVGIILGPELGNVIAPTVMAAATELRTIAVMVILMKAGLGLDRDKLAQQGSVALRLGFLPATCEAIAIAVMAVVLFQFNWATGLLLGCIIGAESPAVIVPGMLHLKRLGWGVSKGIPDAILTGSALSDVLLLLVFSLLLAMLSQGGAEGIASGLTLNPFHLSPLQLLPLQLVTQIGLGLVLGWLAARGLSSLLTQQRWTQSPIQDTLVSAACALLLVVGATKLPLFSGYLAVMALGFFLVEYDAPLARRLRHGFDGLWRIAEIFLFVLLGASIQLQVLGDMVWVGLLVLAVGTGVGRSLGWYLSTLGSNWTWKERLFLLPGNSAKATVQAAIGAIPLAQGLDGGEMILALSALSILVTAPLGAWAIPTFAPKLLQRGTVDPTKVSLAHRLTLLAAVDTSPLAAAAVLKKTAELARRSDSDVLVLHVLCSEDAGRLEPLRQQIQHHLADIRHQFLTPEGSVPDTIIQVAQTHGVAEIILGKRNHPGELGTAHYGPEDAVVGSVSRAVLGMSRCPVVIVESESP